MFDFVEGMHRQKMNGMELGGSRKELSFETYPSPSPRPTTTTVIPTSPHLSFARGREGTHGVCVCTHYLSTHTCQAVLNETFCVFDCSICLPVDSVGFKLILRNIKVVSLRELTGLGGVHPQWQRPGSDGQGGSNVLI